MASLTVNRFLPFARRRAKTFLPFFELMRSRKPCLFFLFLRLGWYVLFICTSPSIFFKFWQNLNLRNFPHWSQENPTFEFLRDECVFCGYRKQKYMCKQNKSRSIKTLLQNTSEIDRWCGKKSFCLSLMRYYCYYEVYIWLNGFATTLFNEKIP